MKLATLAAILGSTAAFAPAQTGRSPTAVSETKADLEVLAKKLNPIVPFFDPLGLADQEFWGESNEATIGFLRESEVKHGRIAMFAFVGYIVHANGITWPWAMTLAGDPFPKVSSAPEAWDAIPESAKLQIVLFIGFLEYVSRELLVTSYSTLLILMFSSFPSFLTFPMIFIKSVARGCLRNPLHERRKDWILPPIRCQVHPRRSTQPLQPLPPQRHCSHDRCRQGAPPCFGNQQRPSCYDWNFRIHF
mmetsp:Transcript_22769/g.45462  ORF Transcript_22769/g.45462 Transcript_22769/m.45462 type:complete len:248 (-) Transcript_22769:361-1104(-)